MKSITIWLVMGVFYMEGYSQEERSTAMGVIDTGNSIARGIGLNIEGWLLAMGFLRVPFLIAVIFYGLSIVLFYVFFGRTNQSNLIRSVRFLEFSLLVMIDVINDDGIRQEHHSISF
jgi:hypothetical protein